MSLIISLLKAVLSLLLIVQSSPVIDEVTRQQAVEISQSAIATASDFISAPVPTPGVGYAEFPDEVITNQPVVNNPITMYEVKVLKYEAPTVDKFGTIDFQILKDGFVVRNEALDGHPLMLPENVSILSLIGDEGNQSYVLARSYNNNSAGLVDMNSGKTDGMYNDFYSINFQLGMVHLNNPKLKIRFQGEDLPEALLK